ncbi:hypothetical protein M569_10527, partial [Genlisea aurea]
SENKRNLAVYSLEYKSIRGDGNCLFSAVAEQIGISHTPTSIRIIAIDYMRNHTAEFEEFIPNFNKQVFDQRLVNMSNDGVWGDMYEIYALAEYFQRPIVIVHDDIKRNHIIFNQNAQELPIFLYYTMGLHYDAL